MKDNVIIKNNKYKINTNLSVELESRCFSRPRKHQEYEDIVEAHAQLTKNSYPHYQGGFYLGPQSLGSALSNSLNRRLIENGFFRLDISASSFTEAKKEVDCINADVLAEGYGNHVFQGARKESKKETESNKPDREDLQNVIKR